MTTRYDAIVIGTGQSGPSLAGALAAQLGILALIVVATIVIEKRRHGRLSHGGAGLAERGGGSGFRARLWRGPWPLLIGGVVLALLNAATLALAGHGAFFDGWSGCGSACPDADAGPGDRDIFAEPPPTV